MSIETLTGDEFMRLEAADHKVALALYDGALSHSLTQANTPGTPEAERDMHLDQLTSLLTLRKLHRVRLEEMEGDEQMATPISHPAHALAQ